MSNNNYQDIILSRKSVSFIILIGVALLTLCYVLGVQVGQHSAISNIKTLNNTGEDLDSLPNDINEQIKDVIENNGKKSESVLPFITKESDIQKSNDNKVKSTPVVPNVAIVSEKVVKLDKIDKNINKKTEDVNRWTLQLISTPDLSEVRNVVRKAQASGFSVVIIQEKGFYKARLSKAGSREYIDTIANKLKSKGFKTFAIKV